MDHALKTIKTVLIFTSFTLAGVFSAISALINHNNANAILSDSYKLAAENTSKSLAYALKIGDLNLVQARLNDLYSVIQAESIYIYDTGNNNIVTAPAFSTTKSTTCKFDSINTPIKYSEQPVGSLNICFKKIEFKMAYIDIPTMLWFLLSFGILFLFIFKIIQNRFSEIKILFQKISSLSPESNFLQISENELKYPENRILTGSINTMIVRIQKYEKDLEKLRISEQLAKLAAQVSHDIRSPLSALNLVYSNLGGVSEENRLLIRRSIQRINDIANDLLAKGKPLEGKKSEPDVQISTSLLSAELDAIISEKRIEFRDKINVDIAIMNPELAYGIFANINSKEFKRVVSNLVNNSVEAFNGAPGAITASVTANHQEAWVTIKDNGPGIPKEILAKLGEFGASFGKENMISGSGLGVYHAKNAIFGMGGSLQIDSEIMRSTTITMKFPRIKPPAWFIEKIELYNNWQIISLDDDNAIHGLWMSRLKELKAGDFGIEFLSFSSIDKFTEWFDTSFKEKGKTLFLIDYELLGQRKSGLDVIEDLKIEKQSILVTSRYDDRGIKNRCEIHSIKMIPKEIAGFIPIEIQSNPGKLDYILIDNDPLILSTWKLNAKNKGHKVKFFNSFAKFQKEYHLLETETPIYIDSNLGEDDTGKTIKGEEVALDILVLGFKNLYLTTGENADYFLKYSYLKGIIGKDPI